MINNATEQDSPTEPFIVAALPGQGWHVRLEDDTDQRVLGFVVYSDGSVKPLFLHNNPNFKVQALIPPRSL